MSIVRKIAVAAAALLMAASGAMAQSAFRASGPTLTLAVTATSGRVQVEATDVTQHARVYNAGTVAVFVNCGDVTVVATTAAGMPIAPGTVEVIGCLSHLAGITASGTATLYVTPGSGI